jgi:hypothetical protein
MNIEANQIRNIDPSGRLLHAGYGWRQPVAWREKAITVFGWTTISVAAVTSPVFLVWVNGGPWTLHLLDVVILSAFILSASGFLIALVLEQLFPEWSDERVAVCFSSSDDIWVTNRRRLFQTFDDFDWVCIRDRAADISNIYLKPMVNVRGGPYRHGGEDGYLAYDVWMLFENGRRICVAEYLDEDDAHIVVAQLNKARREIVTSASLAA